MAIERIDVVARSGSPPTTPRRAQRLDPGFQRSCRYGERARSGLCVGVCRSRWTQIIFQVPSITSHDHTTATTGKSFSFAVTASGYPAPTLTESGALPKGVSFSGGVLSMTPAPGTGGSYPITATNSAGTIQQSFTLTT